MRTASAMSRQFGALLGELLRPTGSSRTTLRPDWPNFGFHVDDVAGEARLHRVRRPCAIDREVAG